MNIAIEQFGLTGATALGGLVTAITLWNKFQNKVENLEKDRKKDADELAKDRQEDKEKFEREMARIKEINELQWSKIDEAFRWHAAHEKEAWENRNALELKIALHTGEIDNIRSICKSIESKLDALIEKSDR